MSRETFHESLSSSPETQEARAAGSSVDFFFHGMFLFWKRNSLIEVHAPLVKGTEPHVYMIGDDPCHPQPIPQGEVFTAKVTRSSTPPPVSLEIPGLPKVKFTPNVDSGVRHSLFTFPMPNSIIAYRFAKVKVSGPLTFASGADGISGMVIRLAYTDVASFALSGDKGFKMSVAPFGIHVYAEPLAHGHTHTSEAFDALNKMIRIAHPITLEDSKDPEPPQCQDGHRVRDEKGLPEDRCDDSIPKVMLESTHPAHCFSVIA